jgi:integrase
LAERAGDTHKNLRLWRFEAEPWTPATWNRYRALFSLVYRLASRNGKAKENLARRVEHKPEDNCRIRFLSPEEVKALRAAIARKFPEHLAEFDLALNTGMRKSEQYGARWEHVDRTRRLLTIPRDTGGRTSYVQLNDAALRALELLCERHRDTGFVCGGAKGARHWFEPALLEAQIVNFRWHDLRHTFASRLVISGADVRTVAELQRDRALEMVMRYAHLAPDSKLEAVRRMESRFAEHTDTPVAPAISLGRALAR